MDTKILQVFKFDEIDCIVDRFFDNEVALLTINTSEFKDKYYTEKFLKKEEIKHAQGFKSEVARINYIVSRSVVNKVFSFILRKDVEKIEVLNGKYKKPFVKNNKGIKFNISHTDGLVIVGFSQEEIGVDIEWINKRFEYKDIVNDCFTDSEIEYIGNDFFKFYELWTIREAYLKCDGIGLIRDMKEIEVINISKNWAEISDSKGYNKQLRMIRGITGYIGAICTMEGKWIEKLKKS